MHEKLLNYMENFKIRTVLFDFIFDPFFVAFLIDLLEEEDLDDN